MHSFCFQAKGCYNITWEYSDLIISLNYRREPTITIDEIFVGGANIPFSYKAPSTNKDESLDYHCLNFKKQPKELIIHT